MTAFEMMFSFAHMSSLSVRPDGMKGGGALPEEQGNREELQHERTELVQEARRRGLLRPLRLEVTASRVEVRFSFSRRFNPNKTGGSVGRRTARPLAATPFPSIVRSCVVERAQRCSAKNQDAIG